MHACMRAWMASALRLSRSLSSERGSALPRLTSRPWGVSLCTSIWVDFLRVSEGSERPIRSAPLGHPCNPVGTELHGTPHACGPCSLPMRWGGGADLSCEASCW